MVWGSLVRGRFKESLQVGEKEVAAAVEVKGEEKDEKPQTESFEYKMQPIVLIVAARIRRRPSSRQGARKPRCCAIACRAAIRPTLSSSPCPMPRSARR